MRVTLLGLFAILALAFVSAFAITATLEYQQTPNAPPEAKAAPAGSDKKPAPFDLLDFIKS